MDAASSADACDVCSGRTDVEHGKVTCSAHFLAWLDSDGPPQRSIVHKQYEHSERADVPRDHQDRPRTNFGGIV